LPLSLDVYRATWARASRSLPSSSLQAVIPGMGQTSKRSTNFAEAWHWSRRYRIPASRPIASWICKWRSAPRCSRPRSSATPTSAEPMRGRGSSVGSSMTIPASAVAEVVAEFDGFVAKYMGDGAPGACRDLCSRVMPRTSALQGFACTGEYRLTPSLPTSIRMLLYLSSQTSSMRLPLKRLSTMIVSPLT